MKLEVECAAELREVIVVLVRVRKNANVAAGASTERRPVVLVAAHVLVVGLAAYQQGRLALVHQAEYERLGILLVAVLRMPRARRVAAEYVAAGRLDERECVRLAVALGVKVGGGEAVSARPIDERILLLLAGGVEAAKLLEIALVARREDARVDGVSVVERAA